MIFSVLYASVLILVIENAFTQNVFMYVFPVVFAVYGVFRYCRFSDNSSARYRYPTAMVCVLLVCYALTASAGSDIPFSVWLFINVSESVSSVLFYIAVFISVSFFVSSVVYYFTLVRCRPIYLMLVLFVAFLFNDQRGSDIHPILISLSIALFIAVITMRTRDFKDTTVRINMKLAAVSAAVLFVFLLPIANTENPENQSENNPLNRGFSTISGLMGYSDTSGAADTRYLDERILYRVQADEPLYLIRQTFDHFDGIQWYTYPGPLTQGYVNWYEDTEARNMDALITYIRRAKANGRLNDVVIPQGLINVDYQRVAVIKPQGISSQFILAPTRTFRVDGVNETVRNARDEIYITRRRGNSEDYTIHYYADSFRADENLQTFSAQFDARSFDMLLDELVMYESAEGYPLSIIAFKAGLSEMQWYRDLWYSVYETGREATVFYSQKLIDLTYEIVKDCNTDYEKACAIERYFFENGFVYDLNFPSRVSEDIEYFVFNAKSGICVHYATAMTIMARIAGLNARYVEGFASAERDSNGEFIVRAKHGHAFVQIAVPAYGWVTFDPTVPSSDSGAFSLLALFFGSYAGVFFVSFSVGIIIMTLIYVFVVANVARGRFRRKLSGKDVCEAMIMIYARVKEELLIQNKAGTNVPAKVIREIALNDYNIDIRRVTEGYNTAAYADRKSAAALTNEDVEASYRQYAALSKELNRPSARLRRILRI